MKMLVYEYICIYNSCKAEKSVEHVFDVIINKYITVSIMTFALVWVQHQTLYSVFQQEIAYDV